jgi:hypothetical protein
MTLRYEGDQAYREVYSAEEVADGVALITKALEALQANCEVMPTDGSDDFRLASEYLDRFASGEILDPIHLARQQGLILLSQDLHLRQWAEGAGVPSTAWLQPALAAAIGAGVATPP